MGIREGDLFSLADFNILPKIEHGDSTFYELEDIHLGTIVEKFLMNILWRVYVSKDDSHKHAEAFTTQNNLSWIYITAQLKDNNSKKYSSNSFLKGATYWAVIIYCRNFCTHKFQKFKSVFLVQNPIFYETSPKLVILWNLSSFLGQSDYSQKSV